MRKIPNNTFKHVQDKDTSKQLKRKRGPTKKVYFATCIKTSFVYLFLQDEKCTYCGFVLQNKLFLRMHLQFEHEYEITGDDDDEENDNEEYK